MMVGIGGNNGTTILGGIIANRDKLSWQTKKGIQHANMFGSMTQASTMKVADSPNG
jgi:myo-inositol-1-phosphate synthase